MVLTIGRLWKRHGPFATDQEACLSRSSLVRKVPASFSPSRGGERAHCGSFCYNPSDLGTRPLCPSKEVPIPTGLCPECFSHLAFSPVLKLCDRGPCSTLANTLAAASTLRQTQRRA